MIAPRMLAVTLMSLTLFAGPALAQSAPLGPAATPPAAAGHAAPAFAMISGYGLYPPLDEPSNAATAALTAALGDISRANVHGIVYGTLGVPDRIRAKLPAGFDANEYNAKLFALAQGQRAQLWLQLRYYDAVLELPSGERTPNADEILADATLQAAFLDAALRVVDDYVAAFPTGATVILGEEETIYHSKEGGGLFWAGAAEWADPSNPKVDGGDEYLKPSTALDGLFAERYVAITKLLVDAIRARHPACRVGLHIGHAALYESLGGAPVYQTILHGLPQIDFTFYDLYEKIFATDADFEQTLAQRVRLLRSLGQEVYYLSQLHTTNGFGHGLGRTPSALEMDETYHLAVDLGVDGFGYYTKNAVATAVTPPTGEDLNPFDPNLDAQAMVFQDSLARWQFGLRKLVKFQQAR